MAANNRVPERPGQEIPRNPRLTIQNRTKIPIIITTSGPDQTFDFEREDFEKEVLDIVVDYAVDTRKESGDKYKLKIGTNIINLSQRNGLPAPISDNAPGGDPSFRDEFQDNKQEQTAYTEFRNSSDTGLFNFNVVKGKAVKKDELSRDYISEVLESVNVSLGDSELAHNVERVLERNNRFSGRVNYLENGADEEKTNVGRIVIQKTIGSHSPKSSEPIADAVIGDDPNEEDIRATLIRVRTLKNLGMQLLLKASGEVYVADDPDDFKQSMAQRASSMVPGLARLGIKVPTSNFSPENLLREINPNFSKPKNPELKDEQNFSHGNFNNPLAPFDAFDSRSSAAAAAILVTTITSVMEVLSRVFDPKSGLQSPIIGEIFNVINNIAIPTAHDYPACVREGAKIFFGLEGPDGLLGIIGSAFTTGLGRFNDEPGYYNMILRNLVKMVTYEFFGSLVGSVISLPGIPNTLGNFNLDQVTNDSGLDINPNFGFTNDPTNILNTIRRILRSRLIGFMNILANIGNIALSLKDADTINKKAGLKHPGVTYDDLIEDVISTEGQPSNQIKLASLIYKNNLSPVASPLYYDLNIRALAWGASTTPSAYILPMTVQLGAHRIGGGPDSNNFEKKLKKEPGVIDSNSNRLSSDDVKTIEDRLEASYVPFYFHDLRTNEIISFHAFLENISDGFDVEYSENSGYGRIGKILTYKNTNRAISLSFIAAATNPQDFDMMWWKINKLVTLVYPQYTAGRTIEIDDNKFIQPFSQLPASSPLIRLRLGDIFRSNYSKFNLARLFGAALGEDQFKIGNSPPLPDQIAQEATNQAIETIRSRQKNGIFSPGETLFIDIQNVGGPLASTYFINSEFFSFGEIAENQFTLPGGSSTVSPVRLTSGRYHLQVTEGPIIDILGLPGNTPNRAKYKLKIIDDPGGQGILNNKEYMLTVATSADSVTGFAGGALEVIGQVADILLPNRNQTRRTQNRNAVLILDESSIWNIALSMPIPSSDATGPLTVPIDEIFPGNPIQDFFKTDKNPIFKAFETTKGRGLAGFIKSIKFNWNDSTWHIDGLNWRAPKLCKIDIEFAPIHDLNPGLDVNGFNTAPVYRVGDISNATNNSVFEDKTEQDEIASNFATNARVAVKSPANFDNITNVAGAVIQGNFRPINGL